MEYVIFAVAGVALLLILARTREGHALLTKARGLIPTTRSSRPAHRATRADRGTTR